MRLRANLPSNRREQILGVSASANHLSKTTVYQACEFDPPTHRAIPSRLAAREASVNEKAAPLAITHLLELKPGGLWLVEMKWGDNSHYQQVEYTEVTPPERPAELQA